MPADDLHLIKKYFPGLSDRQNEQFAQFSSPTASFSVIPLHERFFLPHVNIDKTIVPELPLSMIALFLADKADRDIGAIHTGRMVDA